MTMFVTLESNAAPSTVDSVIQLSGRYPGIEPKKYHEDTSSHGFVYNGVPFQPLLANYAARVREAYTGFKSLFSKS